MATNFLKNQTKNLLPFSHEMVAKNLPNAVITLNAKQRIIDINPAAMRLFGVLEPNIIGKDIRSVPGANSLNWEMILRQEASKTNVRLPVNGIEQQFEVQQLPLFNWVDRVAGHVISLYNITQAEELSNALHDKSLELQYNYEVQSTLAQIVFQMGYSSSPRQALEIMATHLRKLGLEFIFGILDEAQEELTIEFISLNTKNLQRAEKLAGVTVKGYKLSAFKWPFDELFQSGRVIYGNTFELVCKRLPQIPEVILKRVYGIAQVPINASLVYLPLSTKEKNIGALSIWGHHLKNINQDILRLFANQIAATLDNAHRYKLEKELNQELARSNTFITALSKVALKLESVSSPDHILDILSAELRELKIYFMLALLKENNSTLILRHISAPENWLKIINKLIRRKAIGTLIHQKDMPFWKKIVEDKESIVFEDSFKIALEGIASASKIPAKMIEPGFRALFKRADWNNLSIWHPLVAKSKVVGTINFWGRHLRKSLARSTFGAGTFARKTILR